MQASANAVTSRSRGRPSRVICLRKSGEFGETPGVDQLFHSEAIPSQAIERSVEGVETRQWSLGISEMVNALERPTASDESRTAVDDIVRSSCRKAEKECLGHPYPYNRRSNADCAKLDSTVWKCQRRVTGTNQPQLRGFHGVIHEMHRVNSGKPSTIIVMAIPSEAPLRSGERVETRTWSLGNSETVKFLERPAPSLERRAGDDIVHALTKVLESMPGCRPARQRSNLRCTSPSGLVVLRRYERTSKLSGNNKSTLFYPDLGWNCRPAVEQSADENRVNCWNPLTVPPRAISSQAIKRLMEGSTTRPWSLGCSEMVKAHECAAPLAGDDIVWTASKDVEVEGKLSDGNKGFGQAPIRRTMLVLPSRRRSPRIRFDYSGVQQWHTRADGIDEISQADYFACAPELQRERRILFGGIDCSSGSAKQWSYGSIGPDGEQSLFDNRVNCWDALKPSHHNVVGNDKRDGSKSEWMVWMHQWVISSQVSSRGEKGSTTRARSLSETVKPHECATPLVGEDIVLSAVKAVGVENKHLERGVYEFRKNNGPKSHPVHDRRSMKAVAKSTSNGGTLNGQSRAEFCGNANQGVETCAYSYGKKHGVESGEEPGLLNGGHESFATREGIVRSFEQSKTQGRFRPATFSKNRSYGQTRPQTAPVHAGAVFAP